MSEVSSTINLLKANVGSLIKSRQTLLLTLTGITGYLCQPTQPVDWLRALGLVGSLLLTISGSTVMNMIIDRDIDRKMTRTGMRPLATGEVGVQPALLMGSALIFAGLFWSLILSPLYFLIVLTGALVNIFVYSLWLKRVTAWSIFFGGIAGGMPILAGRALAIGRIDALGILLALIIVFWIPGHNLTLDMLYLSDYQKAGVPTAVIIYGAKISYFVITVSNLIVAALVTYTSYLLNITGFVFAIIIAGSAGMVIYSLYTWLIAGKKANQTLYKYVSIYLLILMLTLSLAGFF